MTRPDKGLQERWLFMVNADDEEQLPWIKTPGNVNERVERADLVTMGCNWSVMVVHTIFFIIIYLFIYWLICLF